MRRGACSRGKPTRSLPRRARLIHERHTLPPNWRGSLVHLDPVIGSARRRRGVGEGFGGLIPRKTMMRAKYRSTSEFGLNADEA